jgi:hypothetical protein
LLLLVGVVEDFRVEAEGELVDFYLQQGTQLLKVLL